MNKKVVMFFTFVGLTIGSFVPMLWGNDNMFGGMSILFSTIGGIVGIWLGVQINKRYF
ncbi:MAG TPA: hypothetical protein VFQ70_02745 [Candidatus Saccharimonadaceae bacterium]|nr:hypothetical protein [Candidatus Saccharimonadaceae bacterium]